MVVNFLCLPVFYQTFKFLQNPAVFLRHVLHEPIVCISHYIVIISYAGIAILNKINKYLHAAF